MASPDLRKELECSICLSTYRDPVNLHCGHNYCRGCINYVLDTQDQSGRYFCPQCRGKFQSRPPLHTNIALRNIVDSLTSAQLGKEDSGTLCTYCIHFPTPAVKSCLLCEAYLCDHHLKAHSKAAEHVISDPEASPENRKCKLHKKILEFYCTEEGTCVCVYCLIGEHAGHPKEPLDEAFEKKKEEMSRSLGDLTTKRGEIEKRVEGLQERKRTLEEKAVGDTTEIVSLFGDLRRQLQDLEKRLLSEISEKAQEVSLSLSDLIQKLEMRKDELSGKVGRLEKMWTMTDPLTFLQESGSVDLGDTEVNVDRYEELLHDGEDLDVTGISQTLRKLSDMVTGVDAFFRNKPNQPEDILLDVNTAGYGLQVSEDLKTASLTSDQDYPERPERFNCPQVISLQNFTSGQHSVDVYVGASDRWRIGACYPSIQRRTWPQLLIGYNDQSWCLQRSGGDSYVVIHRSREVKLQAKVSSSRVRICLDYEAGRLSFHELGGPNRHLHTFTANFVGPLHFGLWVGSGHVKLLGDVKC